MRILYINNYFSIFSRLDCGASNRSTMFIRALADLGQVDVISFLGEETSDIKNCTVIYSENLKPIESNGRLSKIFKLFQFNCINNLYLISRQKEEIIDSFINLTEYDYIAVRYLREASECNLFKYKDRLIIDVDDNPKAVALMQAKTAKTLRNRMYSYLFAHTIGCATKKALSEVFCCFHSNPSQPPTEKSVYLHNVSYLDASNADISNHTPLRILIVGLFHYGPNLQGVEHFLSNVFPIIQKSNPEITLHIVGKLPSKEIKERWTSIEGVTALGYVEDLGIEYKNARMVLVPLYYGTGTSVKMVEAMVMNRVCVSTPQGVRGNESVFTPDIDYLLADNDAQFVSQILNNINDTEKCNKIAHNGANKVLASLSKEKFVSIVTSSVTSRSKS